LRPDGILYMIAPLSTLTPKTVKFVREVTIPSVGMAMTEAVLNAWFKNPGDSVAIGEALAEIETDKSSLDVESPSDGVLGRHLVSAGSSVPVGQVIVRVLEPGEVEPHDHDGPHAAAETTVRAGRAAPGAGAETAGAETVRAGPQDRVPHSLSPRKRRELREQAEAQTQAEAQARTGSGQRGPRFRAAIAEHVSESWRTIPHFAVVRQIDARSVHESMAAMRGNGLPATVTDLLLRALALAVEAEGAGDIGLAVATPDGVVIPVVAGVPGLRPAALVAARAAAVARARAGQLLAGDLAGGPVASLSNLGGHGVDSFTGIIPVGQKLLLTTGAIADRPVAVDGLVTVRPSFAATLNVDHRHFDGDNAARILAAFQSALDESITWAAHREKPDA
jgi:pyruvate dehydrogenase E2 component (dihydrolipoamide acetyltransferase)